jgi:hypothetical protein
MGTPVFVSAGTGSGGSVLASTITITNFEVTGNLLVVGVSLRGANRTVSNIKWNTTEDLTKLENVSSDTNEAKSEIWYLKNPTVKTSNVVVTLSGTAYCAAIALDIDGADVNGTTFGTPEELAGIYLGAMTLDIESVADDLVVDVIGKKFSDATDGVLVAGANQTSRGTAKSANHATDSNNIYMGMSTEVATGVSTTMSWTWTAGNRYAAQIGVAINGVSGIPGVKTINGIANPKTVNGIAVADIKSIQGLS